MTGSNGLAGQIKAVAGQEGLEVVGARNVLTRQPYQAPKKSAEQIVDAVFDRTAKFFRDTSARGLDELCIKFSAGGKQVMAIPMWSSEFDVEGWEPEDNWLVVQRDSFYDKKERGLAVNDEVRQLRDRAVEIVRTSFPDLISDPIRPANASIGVAPLVATGRQADLAAAPIR